MVEAVVLRAVARSLVTAYSVSLVKRYQNLYM